MIRATRLALGAWLCFATSAMAQEKIAVLVPGFFNIPGQHGPNSLEYFSQTIVDTVKSKGYTPVLFTDLNPVGSFAENGARVRDEFVKLVAAHPNANYTVIAHSAGGLYVAHALTDRPDLPISTVVTISTPYAGAEIVDLLKWIPGFKTITDALDLSALREFEKANMSAALSGLRIPQNVRWVALGASQPTCFLLTCAKAQYQTWLLSLGWTFAHKAGDGVVALESAEASGTQLRSLEGGVKNIETWQDFVIPLEHWKTVLNANFFTIMGETNPGWIDSTQRQVFSKILARVSN